VNQLDEKYQNLARAALFNGLHDCKFQDDVSLKVEKSEILKAFNYSEDILSGSLYEDNFQAMANAVFESCIRLARCLFFPMEARTLILQGKQYSITAEQQLEALTRNLKALEEKQKRL
jgi:hypothetical protein